MGQLQAMAGELPQPEEEGQRRLAQVVGQPAAGVEVGLLKDVGRIDAALDARVEAQLDHALEARAVAA